MNPITTTLLAFANDRALSKTFCPSEIARNLFPDNWPEKMEAVRLAADQLVKQNILEAMQKGEVKNELPSQLHGPIRLRLKQ